MTTSIRGEIMKIQLQNNVTECMFEKQYIEKQINKVNDKVFNPHAYNVEISDEGYSLSFHL